MKKIIFPTFNVNSKKALHADHLSFITDFLVQVNMDIKSGKFGDVMSKIVPDCILTSSTINHLSKIVPEYYTYIINYQSHITHYIINNQSNVKDSARIPYLHHQLPITHHTLHHQQPIKCQRQCQTPILTYNAERHEEPEREEKNEIESIKKFLVTGYPGCS